MRRRTRRSWRRRRRRSRLLLFLIFRLLLLLPLLHLHLHLPLKPSKQRNRVDFELQSSREFFYSIRQQRIRGRQLGILFGDLIRFQLGTGGRSWRSERWERRLAVGTFFWVCGSELHGVAYWCKSNGFGSNEPAFGTVLSGFLSDLTRIGSNHAGHGILSRLIFAIIIAAHPSFTFTNSFDSRFSYSALSIFSLSFFSTSSDQSLECPRCPRLLFPL